ncbi:MAG TPA: hypothetical protein VME66_03420 [Candidatus Acidoferrales bacterium]|nr:hypothetical protein [Candidatus Acidoferrales bacterium]
MALARDACNDLRFVRSYSLDPLLRRDDSLHVRIGVVGITEDDARLPLERKIRRLEPRLIDRRRRQRQLSSMIRT